MIPRVEPKAIKNIIVTIIYHRNNSAPSLTDCGKTHERRLLGPSVRVPRISVRALSEELRDGIGTPRNTVVFLLRLNRSCARSLSSGRIVDCWCHVDPAAAWNYAVAFSLDGSVE